MAEGFSFDIDSPDLRGLLAHVKSFDPKLATELRRELRRSGDEIIAEQKAGLAGPKPGGIRKSGEQIRLVRPKGRAPYLARRNIYTSDGDRAAGESNLREEIGRRIVTRVLTGSRRQSVVIRTNGPREGGYNQALMWEKRMWRHPVFGNRNAWVYQQGRPYFWDPIRRNTVKMQTRIADAIETLLNRMGDT